jgi:hypothetical protein
MFTNPVCPKMLIHEGAAASNACATPVIAAMVAKGTSSSRALVGGSGR